jgi:hypothetical protein
VALRLVEALHSDGSDGHFQRHGKIVRLWIPTRRSIFASGKNDLGSTTDLFYEVFDFWNGSTVLEVEAIKYG